MPCTQKTIFDILYQGTGGDPNKLEAKVKSFASLDAVIEELLNNVSIQTEVLGQPNRVSALRIL